MQSPPLMQSSPPLTSAAPARLAVPTKTEARATTEVLQPAEPAAGEPTPADHDPMLYGPPPPPAPVQPAALAPPDLGPSDPIREHASAESPAGGAPEETATAPYPVQPYIPATAVTPILVAASPVHPRGGWLLAAFGWSLRLAIILMLIGAGLAAIAWPVWRESQRLDVEIRPMAVPAEFLARGFGPEVAASRLLDALEEVAIQTTENSRNRPSKDELGAIPAFVVIPDRPTLRHFASMLREATGQPTRRIAGEIVVLADNRITVRLRAPGGSLIATATGAAGEDIEQVFATVALEVWRRLNPLVFAWHVAESGAPEDIIRPKLVALAQEMRLPGAVELRVSVLYCRSLVRSGRAGEALATLESLERRAQSYPLLWNVKAQALADLGRSEAAMEAQKQATTADGSSVWSHISSAHLLMKLGKPREAMADLQSARRLQSNNFDAVMLESQVLLSVGRPVDALRLIIQVIDARPALPGVQEALGSALLANGRPNEALAAYDVEIARNPAAATARLSRASALRALRRPEEALAVIDAILAGSPRDGVAAAMRGWTLLDLRRAEDALVIFDLLLTDKPDDASALHGRAASLTALGRRPEAIGALTRAVELQPGNRRAVVDLARLRGVPPPPAASPGTGPSGSAPAARP